MICPEKAIFLRGVFGFTLVWQKGIKLKFRKFLSTKPIFVEAKVEKPVGTHFFPSHPE